MSLPIFTCRHAQAEGVEKVAFIQAAVHPSFIFITQDGSPYEIKLWGNRDGRLRCLLQATARSYKKARATATRWAQDLDAAAY